MTDTIGYLGKGNIRVAKELFDVISNEKANRDALCWTANAIGEVRVGEIAQNLKHLLWEDHIQGNLENKVREAIEDLEFSEISDRLFHGIIYNKEQSWDYIKNIKDRSNEISNKNKSVIARNLVGKFCDERTDRKVANLLDDAIRDLGYKDQKVAGKLVKVLSDGKANQDALKYAAYAVGRLGVKSVVSELREIRWRSSVSDEVEEAIRRLDPPRWSPPRRSPSPVTYYGDNYEYGGSDCGD